VAPSSAEQTIIWLVTRAKLFVFLRHQRHEVFDAAFQTELGTLYKESSLSHPPVPAAQPALATILQAYTGVSDDEVIEATAALAVAAGVPLFALMRSSASDIAVSRASIGTRAHAPNIYLDLAEGHLNRVEVRRVGRQEEHPAPSRIDRGTDRRLLVD
jgi:hypothetical protein